MAFELRPNSGSLFKNTRAREGKQDPNADGRILLSAALIEKLYHQGGDQLIKVSAWTKKQNDGTPWQSLSVREWEERGSAPRQAAQQEELDDDIPF